MGIDQVAKGRTRSFGRRDERPDLAAGQDRPRRKRESVQLVSGNPTPRGRDREARGDVEPNQRRADVDPANARRQRFGISIRRVARKSFLPGASAHACGRSAVCGAEPFCKTREGTQRLTQGRAEPLRFRPGRIRRTSSRVAGEAVVAGGSGPSQSFDLSVLFFKYWAVL